MSEVVDSRALIITRKAKHFDQALTNEDYVDYYGANMYLDLLEHPTVKADLDKARMLAEMRTLVNSSELIRILAAVPEEVAALLLYPLLVKPEPRSLEQVIEEIKRQAQALRGRRAPRTRGPQGQ